MKIIIKLVVHRQEEEEFQFARSLCTTVRSSCESTSLLYAVHSQYISYLSCYPSNHVSRMRWLEQCSFKEKAFNFRLKDPVSTMFPLNKKTGLTALCALKLACSVQVSNLENMILSPFLLLLPPGYAFRFSILLRRGFWLWIQGCGILLSLVPFGFPRTMCRKHPCLTALETVHWRLKIEFFRKVANENDKEDRYENGTLCYSTGHF